VTKKEIVRQIAERIHETQLKTKEIVQLTFDAIVDTLIQDRRIELRNFGVFEVKLRKARKARNPRTDAEVQVPPKFVVTFKPGKEMEERVRKLTPLPHELARLAGRGNKAKKAAAGETPDEETSPAVPQQPAPAESAPVPAAHSDNNGLPGEGDNADAAGKKKRGKKAPQQV
jgi:nucleoid DNA-binding protein